MANNNVIFKTSIDKTIDDLFTWNKNDIQPNYENGVPFSLGTLYFTSDGHIVFDTQIKNSNNQLENTRLWMSKNAYSAMFAEDIDSTSDIANSFYSLTGGVKIEDKNQDLDDYITPGNYYAKSAVSRYLTNGPYPFKTINNDTRTDLASFILKISYYVGETPEYVKQELQEYNKNFYWVRKSENKGLTWSPWKINTSFVYDTQGEPIPSGADLNTYVTPGIYYSSSATTSQTLYCGSYLEDGVEKKLPLPSPLTLYAFKLIVIKAGYLTSLFQILCSSYIQKTNDQLNLNTKMDRVYIRSLGNTALKEKPEAWTNWKFITGRGNGAAIGSQNQPIYYDSENGLTPTDFQIDHYTGSKLQWSISATVTNSNNTNYQNHRTALLTANNGLALLDKSNDNSSIWALNINSDSFSITSGQNTIPPLVPVATNNVLGGIQIGYAENNKKYAVKLDDNNKAYVEVPWDYPTLTVNEMKKGTENVDSVLTAQNLKTFLSTLGGTGLSLSQDQTNGIVLNHSNSIEADSTQPSNEQGTTINIPYINYDAQGHITGKGTYTISAQDLGLSQALKFIGRSEDSKLFDGSDSQKIYCGNKEISAQPGYVVIDYNSNDEYVWVDTGNNDAHWERLGPDSSYKLLQTAISKPQSETNKWISAIGQDINGNISVDYQLLDTSGQWQGNAGSASTVNITIPEYRTTAGTDTYYFINSNNVDSSGNKQLQTFKAINITDEYVTSFGQPYTITSLNIGKNNNRSVGQLKLYYSVNTGTIKTAVLTENRTYTLPNETGTIALKATTLAGYGITDAKIIGNTITLGTNTIIPLTADSTLNATKLSGTLLVTQGGTGSTTFRANSLLKGNGTGAISQASGVGNETTPIYIDANGEPRPITSYSGTANSATSASTIYVNVTTPEVTGDFALGVATGSGAGNKQVEALTDFWISYDAGSNVNYYLGRHKNSARLFLYGGENNDHHSIDGQIVQSPATAKEAEYTYNHILPQTNGWIVKGSISGVGNTTTPVYLDTNGALQTITSYNGTAASANNINIKLYSFSTTHDFYIPFSAASTDSSNGDYLQLYNYSALRGTINTSFCELFLGKPSDITGRLRLYSSQNDYFGRIQLDTLGLKQHSAYMIPKTTNGKNWIVVGGTCRNNDGTGGSGVGSDSQPVYLNNNGILQTITSYNGNAATASSLQSSRNLQVSLSSTTPTGFNGSVDVLNIGVSGILSITNGGTGAGNALDAITALGGSSIASQGKLLPLKNSQDEDILNLDDYTTPGTYYVVNATSAARFSNGPTTGLGYKLIVMKGSYTGSVIQIAILMLGSTCSIRVRGQQGSTPWTAWRSL